MGTGASLLNLNIYVTFRDLETDLYYLDIESGLTHDTAPHASFSGMDGGHWAKLLVRLPIAQALWSGESRAP